MGKSPCKIFVISITDFYSKNRTLWSPVFYSMNMKRARASGVRNHPELVRHAPLKIALNERLDEPDPSRVKEGMRAAAPVARKTVV